MTIRLLTTAWLLGGLHGAARAQTATGTFESGLLSPFRLEACCGNAAVAGPLPVPARAGAQGVRFTWAASNYQGTRSSRGIEATHPTRTTKEAWYGFSFYLPSSGFPPDKNLILAQLIAWHPACPTDKTFIVATDGVGLYVGGYAGDGTIKNEFAGTLTTALPRDRWLDVVVHAVFSQAGRGSLAVWYDRAPASTPTYAVRDVNFGNGCFTAGDSLTYGAYPKFGMYCWDVPNYAPNEVREVYFDEVRWQATATPDGYALVHPPGAAPGPVLAASRGGAPAPVLAIFPNPAIAGAPTVAQLNGFGVGAPCLQVFDLTGRLIAQPPVRTGANGQGAATLPTTLVPGCYVLRAADAQRCASSRLVVAP